MRRAQRILLVLVALTATVGAAAPAQAAVSSSVSSGVNAASTDALERFLLITPGTAVQPGTATPVASGTGIGLVVDLGRVPDTRSFNDAVRISNVDTVGRTIDVSKIGINGVAALEFSDGTTVKLIPPATTQQLRIRTDALQAGLQSGQLRLRETSSPAFYLRDLAITTRQAPVPPAGVTAISTPLPSPRINVSWTASVATGVSGYNIYRATAAGGPYAKINAAAVAGTAYADTTAVVGTRYWYLVRAIANAVVPELEGLDSANTNGRIPPTPTSVIVPAAANPVNYINFATRANVTVRVVVPANTQVGDTVNVRLTDGTSTVNATTAAAGGAQTLNLNGINATALADGAITLTSWITRGAAETGSSVTGAATKDTVAAFTGTRVVATATNTVNFISRATGIAPGTVTTSIDLPASSMATDTVNIRLTRAPNTVTGTGAGTGGSGTRTIAGLSTNGWTDGAVTVEGRVRDVAGNDSGFLPGTNAVRDTVLPAAPTAAQVIATAANPVNYVNFVTRAAATVRVTSGAVATDTLEARLTSGAGTAFGTVAGAPTADAIVNATALADTALNGLAVAARRIDQAGNPSAWFNGTAATKDTVMPNAPNFNNITFQNRNGADRVRGLNGALGANDQVRIFDYANLTFYGWYTANGAGNFGRRNVAAAGIPRTIGYEIRDTAWNTLARSCRLYTVNGPGIGAGTACP